MQGINKTDKTKPTWEGVYQKYPLYELPWGQEKPTPQLAKLIESEAVKRGAVLDIGCGAGTNLSYLITQGFSYHGIDISLGAIRVARKEAAAEGIQCDLSLGNAIKLPYRNNSFDFAFDKGCLLVLPTKHREAYVQEVYRVLKPKGKYQLLSLSSRKRFVIKMPRSFSPRGLWRYFKSYILGIDEMMKLFNPLSAEDTRRCFSPPFKIHYINEFPEKGMKYYRLEAVLKK